MEVIGELLRCTGFDWDEANAPKIWNKHRVSPMECEQVFFNLPLVAGHDEKHSSAEKRYYVLGQSDAGRRLFVVVRAQGTRGAERCGSVWPRSCRCRAGLSNSSYPDRKP